MLLWDFEVSNSHQKLKHMEFINLTSDATTILIQQKEKEVENQLIREPIEESRHVMFRFKQLKSSSS